MRSSFATAGVDAKRTAVRWQFFHVEYLNPCASRMRTVVSIEEIREVLVIDRIELVVFDQPQKMRKLKRQNCLRFEQNLQALDKIVQIRDLRQHVVSRAPGRRSGLRPPTPSPADAEKPHQRVGTPFSMATFATFAAGSMPSTGTLLLNEILQQVTVIARDFDHKALAAKAKALNHFVAVILGVLQPGIGIGREIRVVAEDILSARIPIAPAKARPEVNANNPGARLPPNIARRALLKAIAGALAGLVLPRQAKRPPAVRSVDRRVSRPGARARHHG